MLIDASQLKLREILEVRIEEAESCLTVVVAGRYSFENLYTVLDLVKVETEKRGKNVVLLDITRVAGPVSNFDMHELGLHLARVWNRSTRLAIVSPKGGLSKFFECLMWTRGLQVGVVPDLCAAADWLAEAQ